MNKLKNIFSLIIIATTTFVACAEDGDSKGSESNFESKNKAIKVDNANDSGVQQEMVTAEDVVSWEFKVEQSGCDATLIIRAVMDEGWHVYSMKHKIEEADFTGMPTSFEFSGPDGSFELEGGVKEGAKPHEHIDDMGRSLWFEHEATWKQKIKINSKTPFKIKVSGGYMTCNESGCLPPADYSGSFDVDGCSSGTVSAENVEPEEGDDPAETENGSDEETTNVESSTHENETAEENKGGPVTWEIWYEEAVSGELYLKARAKIDTGWVMAAQPVKTYSDFSLDLAPLKGEVKSDSWEVEDPELHMITGLEVSGWRGKVTFSKEVSIDTNEIPHVKGLIDYVVVSSESDSIAYLQEGVDLFAKMKGISRNYETSKLSDSYWVIFVLSFGGGLLALLTPCVFPMIPMTVSFFTKQSKTRRKGIINAFIYGFSIIVIYVLLGLLVTGLFGSNALNALATNVWLNIAFFVLFVVFAISFFGAFEITLPTSWVNKADKQSDKGGLIGIFFMAFTLALVSFSCTGPIIGTALVQSAAIGGMGPFISMLGFSSALALPFALFAAFPGWLNSLPQSGGWLNSVKVVLGFLELAFALKFLSNADLVVQGHFLEREMFIAVWIAVFALMGFYLLGKIQFPHDSPMERVSVFRGIMAVLIFSFTIYMVPGLWGAPLKVLSGILPPITYSESTAGWGGSDTMEGMPEGTHPGPNGLAVFHEYEEALAYAKEEGKPLMIDFTGYACANCRNMEEKVWTDAKVHEILKNDVVIAALHADDKTTLPESMQTKNSEGNLMTTYGDYWSDFQRVNYDKTSQPQYILLDHNEEMLVSDASYRTHGEVPVFMSWLKNGLQEFKTRQERFRTTPEMLYSSFGDPEIARIEKDRIEGPIGLSMFDRYDSGLAYAKAIDKPLLVYFTGYACVNCRKMEQSVWVDSDVLGILKNQVVIASLAVDAAEQLPLTDQTENARGRKMTTVGDYWSNFQIERYGATAQPFFVLLDHDESELVPPANYRDVGTGEDAFLQWLQDGLANFNTTT